MREKFPAVVLSAAALVGMLASSGAAAPPALPLPIPAAHSEPLVGEGIAVEGPLVNTISLSTLR